MSEKDPIKELFRSKLNDFEAPVPTDGWQRIEHSLAAASHMRVVRRRWIASAAAIAALVIGGWFFLNTPEPTEPVLTENAGTMQPAPAAKGDTERAEEKASVAGKAERLMAKVTQSANKGKSKASKQPALIAAVSRKMAERMLAVEKREMVFPEPTIPRSDTAGETSEMSEEEIDRLLTELADRDNQSDSYIQLGNGDKNPLTFALNGGGGLTSSQRTVNAPMTLRSAAKMNNDRMAEPPRQMLAAMNAVTPAENVADNISEMIHSQPVSVGFTVSKNVTDRLSLETGLVYTYLYSKAKNTSTEYKSKETQRLHYVGVPLNVNYNILSLNKFDMYASVGGMIQKDVYGKYEYVDNTVISELNSSSETKVSKRIHQANPQLSVNAGLGASYPIYNKLKVYGKIGGSYYFDAKNEYKTFYSDEKIVLDLNVGLKLDF